MHTQMARHYPYNELNIRVLALSMATLSSDVRYMRVVFSESCPIPSLITDSGIFLRWATLAHEWRATYIVSGISISSISATRLRLALTLWAAYIYCLRADLLLDVLIIGSR